MAAVIAALVSIGVIALAAMMNVRAQRRGNERAALTWFGVALVAALGPITWIVTSVVVALALIVLALWLLPGVISDVRAAGHGATTVPVHRYGSWWGEQQLRYDSGGNLLYVGDDKVTTRGDGTPLYVGDHKVQADGSGNLLWVGDARVQPGSDGRPGWVGDSRVHP